eukprot:scaffold8918_cov59-Phaeocystis_antarctica.AAC.6
MVRWHRRGTRQLDQRWVEVDELHRLVHDATAAAGGPVPRGADDQRHVRVLRHQRVLAPAAKVPELPTMVADHRDHRLTARP